MEGAKKNHGRGLFGILSRLHLKIRPGNVKRKMRIAPLKLSVGGLAMMVALTLPWVFERPRPIAIPVPFWQMWIDWNFPIPVGALFGPLIPIGGFLVLMGSVGRMIRWSEKRNKFFLNLGRLAAVIGSVLLSAPFFMDPTFYMAGPGLLLSVVGIVLTLPARKTFIFPSLFVFILIFALTIIPGAKIIRPPSPIPFSVENFEEGSNTLLIRFLEGGVRKLRDVFDFNEGDDNWRGIKVRVNGVEVKGDFLRAGDVFAEGELLTSPKRVMVMFPNDWFRVTLNAPLKQGDVVDIMYRFAEWDRYHIYWMNMLLPSQR